ncbi:hypothetical protein R1flu_003549 [Riccia fluitans]|uniref:Uncharacterized protein n=1 Tax=Riccia fluitans TaxID=41844 RepID=A0ABD1YCZ7_9MARC
MASRFFMLERLEKVVVKRLSADVPSDRIKYPEEMLNEIAIGLSTLSTYPTHFTEGTNPMFLESIRFYMLYILVCHDMTDLTLSRFSREGFRYYLTMTQSPSTDQVWKWSLEEYRKLIHLLVWSATEVNDCERQRFLPSPQRAAQFLEDGDLVKLFGSGSPSEITKSREKFAQMVTKSDVEDLLPLVDLTVVHPKLLEVIIKPLKIIDGEILGNVLGIQAIRGSRWLRNYSQLYGNPVFHKKQKNLIPGIFCHSSDKDKGDYKETWVQTACIDRPMYPDGIYKWTVLPELKLSTDMEEISGWCLDIGFLNLCYGESFTETETETVLRENRRGWYLMIEDGYDDTPSILFYRGRSLLDVSDEHNEFENVSLLEEFQFNCTIEVEVNRIKNFIQISYGRNSETFELDDVPGGLLYPVVSVNRRGVQITTTLRDGFDHTIGV